MHQGNKQTTVVVPEIDYTRILRPEETLEGSPLRRSWEGAQAAKARMEQKSNECRTLESELRNRFHWLDAARWGETDIQAYIKVKAEADLLTTSIEAKKREIRDAALRLDGAEATMHHEWGTYQDAVQRRTSIAWERMTAEQRNKEIISVIQRAVLPA